MIANEFAFSAFYRRRVSQEALKISSEACGVSVTQITSVGGRQAHIAFARHIAMYLCHVVGQMSLREVAREFGRDRTTVGHACHAVEDMRDNPTFDKQIDFLERELRKRLVVFSRDPKAAFFNLERKGFRLFS